MAVGHHAVRKARLDTGDAALVIGCGPVGQFAARAQATRAMVAAS